MDAPHTVGAKAARVRSQGDQRSKKQIAADVFSEYLISALDMAMIHVSPDLYGSAFEEELNLQKFDINTHRTAGLCFFEKNNQILLASMAPSTPGAWIPWWQTRIWGAWLIEIDGTPVASISDAKAIFLICCCPTQNWCTLLFSHPEITPDISHHGLPAISKSDISQFIHGQLNNQVDFIKDGLCIQQRQKYDIVDSDSVLNYTTGAMKLTRGKLMNQANWTDWQVSEYIQLDQYNTQGMFSNPVTAADDDVIFHLVWMYSIKAVNGWKKPAGSAMGHQDLGLFRFLTKTMLIV
jgi:hypothetical protein